MSDYNSLKNSALTNPTGNLDLGSATNRYGNIFLQGNLAIGNLVATETSLVSPKISSLTYAGDDTAADPTGSQTITINGSGFSSGAAVYVSGSVVSSVTVVSSTQVTFSSPAKTAGNYTLLLVNADGGTATFIPGMQYSGVPSWSTSSGSLASVYEYDAVSSTLAATSDSPVTYSVTSGALPTGVTLASSTGVVSGTAPSQASGSTTYNFTTSAIDGENQDTPRNFSVTVNADAVTWSSPADSTTYSLEQGTAMANVELSAASAAGKSITYTADSLPTGLSISGSNIVGTPTVAANTSSTLTATASTTNKTATKVVNWTVAVASDDYFKSVSLLLTGDGAANNATNNTFTDSSTNALTITRSGTPKQGSFSPYAPSGWSTYFDGTGDYLTTTGFGLSTDFTLEFWSYFTAQPSSGYFTSASSMGPIIAVETAKTILGQNGGWLLNPPNSSAVYPNGVSPLNQWNHWAVVRGSGTLKFYLNGIMLGSTANTTDYSASQTWGIGSANDGTPINVPHYMSNFRVSNVARYSGSNTTVANFTLPTADFVNDLNTTLLTLQSNRLVDNSTNKFAITKFGDTRIQPFSPFAPTAAYSPALHGGSVQFKSSNNVAGGDYLTVPASAASFGTGNFTIELWSYIESTGFVNGGSLIAFTGTSGSFYLRPENSTYWRLTTPAGQINYDTGGTFYQNQWMHHAMVRNSGTTYYYQNGILRGSIADSTNYSATTFYINNLSQYGAGGYTSDVRVVIGTAVYTSAFTPPNAALTAISGTSLLLKGADAGVVDASGKNDLEILADAKISTSVKKYGTGSIYFDGTGDYVYSASSPNFQLSSGDFTIECWVYPTLITGSERGIFGIGTTDPDSNMVRIQANSSKLQFWLGGSNSSGPGAGTKTGIITCTTALSLNTWYHIALVRSGSATNNVKLYLNGTLDGQGTATYNIGAKPFILGGGYPNSAIELFVGHIDEFRVSKGVARYTANFTPPTAKFNLR